jgi:type IV secretion system protein VirD4
MKRREIFMYRLSRLLLMLAACAWGYCGLVAVLMMTRELGDWVLVLFVAALAAAAVRQRRKLRRLTAHGTAAWATEDQLRQAGMIDAARGLFLGRLCGVPARVGLMAAVSALFDLKLKARDACRRFYAALKRHKEAPLVRLPQAINTVCFAPVGAGKSTGLVIPFLLTCDESCVVIDFKGELSLTTALARRRMGHEVIILDPYHLVTQ